MSVSAVDPADLVGVYVVDRICLRCRWPCSVCGGTVNKPEVEITFRWWRMIAFGWNNVQTCLNLMRS